MFCLEKFEYNIKKLSGYIPGHEHRIQQPAEYTKLKFTHRARQLYMKLFYWERERVLRIFSTMKLGPSLIDSNSAIL